MQAYEQYFGLLRANGDEPIDVKYIKSKDDYSLN